MTQAGNSLEAIYEKFNIDHPADYKGRSFYVSDVVEIRESNTLNPGFYFVDSIGFKAISFDKSLCKEPVKAGDRYPYDRELLEGICDLILETVLCKSGTVLIARNEYPVQLVKSKFLKLHSGHIEYVVDCLKGNTLKVRNIKKYLLAALFNAPTTISGYYQAEVNHDMPQLVRN